ncbi:MAG: hypothetical protein ACC645_28570, partial [Pirellulales bacterium]
MEQLEPRMLLAVGALIGVDFDPDFFSPSNWNSYGGSPTPNVLSSLIDEDGDLTSVALAINDSDGFLDATSGVPLASTVPMHTQPLDPIDGAVFDQQYAQFVWRGLQPQADYEVYVFGLPLGQDVITDQDVLITGDGGAIVGFAQGGGFQELWVNGEPGDASRPLDSFAEIVTSDGNGIIQIDVFAGSSGLSLAGLAIRQLDTAQPFVERDTFEDTTALIQLVGGPIGPDPTAFILRGPAEADVFFEGPNAGDAFDNSGNGLDEVQTELVSLSLTDGFVNLSLNPNQPSFGEIEEKVNNNDGLLDLDPFAPGDANSFFDVMFQIDVGGQSLFNQEPLRIQSMISEKPPRGARYIHVVPPTGPIELFDAAGKPTGVFIVKAEHVTGNVEVDKFEDSRALIGLDILGVGPVSAILSGPTEVNVFFEGPNQGDANDDDGNLLDEVATEMVELNLTGNVPGLGPIIVRLDPNQRSLGQIEETADTLTGRLDLPP